MAYDIDKASGQNRKTSRALRSPPSSIVKLRERNACESPLLRLPAEIRNYIYEYVLGGKGYRFRRSCWKIDQVSGRRLGIPPSAGNSYLYANSLLRVCHQIHMETAVLPFKLHIFEFLSTRCFRWVDKVLTPAQLQAVSCIAIESWLCPSLRDGRLPIRTLLPNLRTMIVEHVYPRALKSGDDHDANEDKELLTQWVTLGAQLKLDVVVRYREVRIKRLNGPG